MPAKIQTIQDLYKYTDDMQLQFEIAARTVDSSSHERFHFIHAAHFSAEMFCWI